MNCMIDKTYCPKDVEKGNLVPRTFTNAMDRKVLTEMIILDESI